MKYYHCSPKHYKIGFKLHPINGKEGIWITTSPTPHFTLWDNSNRGNDLSQGNLRVYEVVPLGKVVSGAWDDLISVKGIEIVKPLGQAARSGNVSSIRNGVTKVYTRNKISKNKPRYFVEFEDYTKKGFKTIKNLIKYIKKNPPNVMYIRDRNTYERINIEQLKLGNIEYIESSW